MPRNDRLLTGDKEEYRQIKKSSKPKKQLKEEIISENMVGIWIYD